MKTILLADDSITIQKVVELTFSEGDYQVICVGTGSQALKKVAEVRPDVILLDIIMPEKNGYEVCEELKKDPATASIPVLLLTGTFEPFDEKRADAVGAVGHLTKPFESHALVTRVDELVASGGGQATAAGFAEASESSGPSTPPAGAAESMAGVDAAAPQPPPPADLVRSPYSEPGSEDAAAGVMAPPDPSSGGSFMSAAPIDLDQAVDEVIPDRFDDPPPPTTSTVRISRDELLAGLPDRSHPVPQTAAPGGSPSGDAPRDGFVAGYELPGPEPAGDSTSSSLPSVSVAPADGAAVLTPDQIDRIADAVVRRMSDRAIREIAWEVIPQVAEVIVRNRVKELEDKGDG